MEWELYEFLKRRHRKIGKYLSFVKQTNPNEKLLYAMNPQEEILYESEDGSIAITYGVKGVFEEWVFLHCGQKRYTLYDNIFLFVKYLEWNRRNGTVPKQIEDHIQEYLEKVEKEGKKESPIEPSELKSYLLEEDRILLEKEKYKKPGLAVIDGQKIEKKGFTSEIAEEILQKIYTGEYSRIEITFTGKNGNSSLVYLCEDKKAIVRYFEDKTQYTGIFFENRNGAGMVPINLLPQTQIYGQVIYEQNIVLDRGVLGNLYLEMLQKGRILYDKELEGRKTGNFSRKNFSNKNKYQEYREEKGVFT